MPNRRLVAVLGAGLALLLPLAVTLGADPSQPGPPFPEPVFDQAVYDSAGVFQPSTVATLETTIDAVEARTGAEVVVYTQVWPYEIDQDTSQANAAALIDQWGIGRRGFDDGLVILFDLDPSLVHGQVSLYAGAGFRATFLDDHERQRIFDEDMSPYLAAGDLNGAALIALQRVDAAATPDNARRLEFARQLNAVVGIIGGAIVLFGLGGWAVFHWLRFGRDPVYVDSDSVLVPAPPDGMTAAAGTLVLDGRASRRTLTTALLDLASRGEVAFREEPRLLGLGRKKLSIDLGSKAASAAEADLVMESANAAPVPNQLMAERPGPDLRLAIARSRIARENRRPISGAESYLLERLETLADDETVDSDDVPKLAGDVSTFERQLEDQTVKQGWFARRPSSVVTRWLAIGFAEIVPGGIAVFAGLMIPASGLTVVGIAGILAGAVTLLLASAMPARTLAGAMQRAWLAAYRRTLSRTMGRRARWTRSSRRPALTGSIHQTGPWSGRWPSGSPARSRTSWAEPWLTRKGPARERASCRSGIAVLTAEGLRAEWHAPAGAASSPPAGSRISAACSPPSAR